MCDSSKPFVLRDYPRYAARAGHEPQVTLQAVDSDFSSTGKLIDFSRCGVQVLLAQRPEMGAEFAVAIDALPDQNLKSTGMVCWIRDGEENEHYVGCEFTEPLTYDVVPELSVAGAIERRGELREPTQLPATIQHAGSGSVKVQVVGFSSGGLLVKTPKSIQTGERIALELGDDDDPARIELDVVWSQPNGDEFSVGCAFAEAPGAQVMLRVLAASQTAQPRRSRLLLRCASVAAVLAGVWFTLREILN